MAKQGTIELELAKDTAPKAKVNLVVEGQTEEDGMLRVRCQFHSTTLQVEQAFGDNARYKGRNAIGVVDVRPLDAHLEIVVPVTEVNPTLGLHEMIGLLLNNVVAGVEFAILEAEERENRRREQPSFTTEQRKVLERNVGRSQDL